MTTITVQTHDQELTVELEDETIRPLLDDLQIVSPALANKFDDAVVVPLQTLVLDEREVDLLATAAKTVSNSKVEDPALDQLVEL